MERYHHVRYLPLLKLPARSSAAKVRGMLRYLKRTLRMWKRGRESQNTFAKNFPKKCSRRAIRENLNPRNVSAIYGIPCLVRVLMSAARVTPPNRHPWVATPGPH